MSEQPKRTVIVLRESILGSMIKDLLTVAAFVGLIGIGKAVGSMAMEWAGLVIVVIGLFLFASGVNERHRMTIAEARQRLDELENSHD